MKKIIPLALALLTTPVHAQMQASDELGQVVFAAYQDPTDYLEVFYQKVEELGKNGTATYQNVIDANLEEIVQKKVGDFDVAIIPSLSGFTSEVRIEYNNTDYRLITQHDAKGVKAHMYCIDQRGMAIIDVDPKLLPSFYESFFDDVLSDKPLTAAQETKEDSVSTPAYDFTTFVDIIEEEKLIKGVVDDISYAAGVQFGTPYIKATVDNAVYAFEIKDGTLIALKEPPVDLFDTLYYAITNKHK